jgi:arylsulfatase A
MKITRRDFLTASAATAALAAAGCGKKKPTARKPNIILIMADDIGYECFGAYGSKQYQTPVLDGLAANGIKFVHCYSTPLCTPSRVQIMTGRYNNRNYKAFGYLDVHEKTFGNMLKDAGYKTCITGKWQLNGVRVFPNADDRDRPAHFGFDEYCLWQLTKHRRQGERYSDPLIVQNGETLTGLEDKYGPDIFCDYAMDFMERNQKSPFFLYMPMALTHCPFWPTPDSPEWKDPKARRPGHEYKGDPKFFPDMVRHMDKIVGRITKKLDELGLRENTVVMFTSDNGTDKPIVSQLGDRSIEAGKGQMTDAGTRVPLIVSWPGTAPKGKVCEDLVDFSDFLPTMAALAGAQVPTDRIIDGQSFLPQLKGEKGNPRDWIFCHYWGKFARTPEGTREFVRNQRWKLYDDGKLYDVAADPLEQNPLEEISGEALAVKTQFETVFKKVRMP